MAEPRREAEPAIVEVAIVGGGPVGLGLAIELGQRGVRVGLLERRQSPMPIPRGQNLTQRTMEHFRAWRAEAELRAARTVPKEYGIGGVTAYGSLLSGWAYDWLQRDLVRPFYAADNERLPQYRTEAVLRARAAELENVGIWYGWTADDVAVEGESVAVSASRREGEERLVLHAAYAVGCDGARSLVRERAGIAETRREHDKLMALLVFRSAELHRLLDERFPGKQFYNVLSPELNGYWKFFGRVDLEGEFFFHAPVPPEAREGGHDFAAMLQEAVGARFEVEMKHVGFWDLRIAVADRYRAGRVFLAGDAAHSHPPYGGYGINTGFEDARNLGWKLAARLAGWGGERLLDSYDVERRPVFVSTARDFIEAAIEADRDFLQGFAPDRDRGAFEREWTARGAGARAEVHAFEPHYEGSPVVFGPEGAACDAKGGHRMQARAGHHLAPQTLADGRGVYDALGPDFTLLALGAEAAATQAFEAAARGLDLPLRIVSDEGGAARQAYGAPLILVRPDHFVAWAGKAVPPDPRSVLARTAGAA